jgi:hypothetical protein
LIVCTQDSLRGQITRGCERAVFGTGARDDLSATDDSELLRPSRDILFPERAAALYRSMLHARPPALCQAVDVAWSASIAVTKAGSLLAAEIGNLRIGGSGVLGRRQIRSRLSHNARCMLGWSGLEPPWT